MTAKKLTAVLLAVFTVVFCLPFAAVAETYENIKWEVEDKTLVISPITDTAAIPDYKQGDAPWYSLRNSVENITVNDGITRIGDYAFYGFSKVRTLNYKGAFYNKAVFGSSVTSIGNGTFESCMSLSSVTLPDTVKTIGSSAFRDCTSLTSVCLPQKLYNIDGTAGEIPDYMFSGCTKLEIVTFTGKEMQKYINLPVNITRIGKGAFAKCSLLKSSGVYRFDLPNTVKQIDDFAFDGCSGLEFMQVTLSLEYISPSAFKGCTGFGRFIIYNDGRGEYYTSNNDYYTIYNKSETKLVRFLPATSLTQFKMTEKVETIGDYAFESSVNLETVTLGAGVKSIGRYAFANSAKIKGIFIPKGVTEIKEGAFDNCPSLGAIYYGGSEDDWKSIAINSDNTGLNGKMVYYNSSGIPEKETPNAPSAPELESKTVNSVTLKAVDGYEYRMNDGEWQKSNVFTGLNDDTEYTFYQRIAETESSYASESSKKLTVRTDKSHSKDCTVTGHEWSEWIVTKPAGCTVNGEEQRSCLKCGSAEKRIVRAYGHRLKYTEEKKPTCTEKGHTAYGTCQNEGCTYTDYIEFPPTGHIFGKITVVRPKYGESGYSAHKCTVCGYEEKFDITDPIEYPSDKTLVYTDGKWIYLSSGKPDTDYTGLTRYNGTLLYVEKGVYNRNFIGFAEYNGEVLYVENGIAKRNYTGLKQYDGSLCYIEDGVWNRNYTGLMYYYGTWFYIENGVFNRDYNGLVEYRGKLYRAEDGIFIPGRQLAYRPLRCKYLQSEKYF